jgi:hypothetical protein
MVLLLAGAMSARCLGQGTKSAASDAAGCKVLTAVRGGAPFEDTTSEIRGLSIRAGKYIDAIGVLGGPMHGGHGGTLREVVFAPGEIVTEIRGRRGTYVSSLVVITGTITGMGRTYSFGVAGGGEAFRFVVPAKRSITGFCGSAGSHVEAIGVVIR